MKAELFLKYDAILGEGAWFDWAENKLVWTDIWGKTCHVTDAASGKDTVYPVSVPVTTIVPAKNGYILGTDLGVMAADRSFSQLTPCQGPQLDYAAYRCNDGKCAPDGRFWIGLMERNGKKGDGALYAVSPDRCECVLDKLDVPNGIVWDEKRGKMYFTDTLDATVYAYDYADGKAFDPVPVFHAEKGLTDGMTIDENGDLWIAVWGTCCVYHVNPTEKKVIDVVEVPAPNVTSTAIHNGKLYITSATADLTEEDLARYPLSGSIFAADVPVNGLEAYRYPF